MKGDIVTETIWIIALSVMIILIVFVALPKFWKDIAFTAILSSPEVVIRDIAGLVTISGAAPHDITIYYEVPTTKYSYNLMINGRNITLEMLGDEKILDKITATTSDEIPIDPEASISDSTTFTIEKFREDGKNIYEVSG
ncbi:MAG: hypothetical protein A2Y81_11745 [Nitrospirae bacterium RBG_13_43_8]|nr:MAG: hypothetical protein A2Y81_11745 [Nitrospirae bacterium RBG_13_43_8]